MGLIKRFHLLHTNDLHSRLDGAAQIHHLVTSLREKWAAQGEEGLLIDVGDHMDRMRMETEGTDGWVNRAILEKTGYDLFTFGNNELLTFSKDHLDALFRDASFSVISSNVFEYGSDRQPGWLSPYKIKEVAGVKFGFLAATIPYPLVYEQMGWTVKDPLTVLKEAVHSLRGQVDLLILLSHLGLPNDRLLAGQLEGIDMILGAHTHHLLPEPEREKGTWIAAAGKFAEYLGHVSLEIDLEQKRLIRVEGRCYELKGQEASAEILRLIDRYREEAERNLSEPITYLPEPLITDWYGEAPFANLLADSLRDWVQADIALVNSGQLLKSVRSGLITRKDLHRVCPHPINPALIRIKGKAIKETLEESLLPEFQEQPIRGFGFRGKVLGSMAVSGMKVEYDSRAKPHEKILRIMVGPRELNEEEEYELATIDMFTFGAGYLGLKEGEIIRFYLPEFLRDLLAVQLKKTDALQRCREPRWIDETRKHSCLFGTTQV
ncbi:bifunctional UDP-sugar hydrolase/5'-nucleotidase [Thermoactinomyces sp. CICC 10522]|uniref:bifunctional metallophosphatase/5'-nucleotidase n=1 Tax=Thermoactinomyces sp. CICC 10522 TaxID=2767427 RepID=UPI0018DBD671|nr:bifunctional metallophosphatase/5'-nucleotidase [Thermoactinomyces sp. CICC 10522]